MKNPKFIAGTVASICAYSAVSSIVIAHSSKNLINQIIFAVAGVTLGLAAGYAAKAATERAIDELDI